MKEVVTFFLSGKEYGADVSKIQGIENYVEYAKEPGLSDGFLVLIRKAFSQKKNGRKLIKC